jgi:hypothetical protein
MISAGLQFEHGEAKIKWVAYGILVMTSSSNSLTSDMIVEKVGEQTWGHPMTTEAVAYRFSEECKALKRQRTEQEVLSPLGLTYETFWARAKDLPNDTFASVMRRLETYDYDFYTQFMIIGIDQVKQTYLPHIHIVNQNGNVTSQDFLGFGAIGAGSETAFPELTRHVWTRNIPWQEA